MVKTTRQNRRKGGARKGRKQRARRGAGGGANTTNNAQQVVGVAYMPTVIRNNTPSRRIFQATEFLGTPQITTTLASQLGTEIYLVDINPSTWLTTRAADEASLWGYYRFRKCIFHIESSSPTSFGGQIAVGCDTSVGSTPGGSVATNVGYVLALPGARTAPIWASFSIAFDCRRGYTPFNWFQTSLADPLNGASSVTGSQGRFIMTFTQPAVNVTVGTLLSWTLRVEYSIEFARPQLPTVDDQPFSTVAFYIPQGSSAALNLNGQAVAGSFTTNPANGFSNLTAGQVVFFGRPPVEWFTANSPVPAYATSTGGAGGVVSFWSVYPDNFTQAGDCIGFNSGINLGEQTPAWIIGQV